MIDLAEIKESNGLVTFTVGGLRKQSNDSK